MNNITGHGDEINSQQASLDTSKILNIETDALRTAFNNRFSDKQFNERY